MYMSRSSRLSEAVLLAKFKALVNWSLVTYTQHAAILQNTTPLIRLPWYSGTIHTIAIEADTL